MTIYVKLIILTLILTTPIYAKGPSRQLLDAMHKVESNEGKIKTPGDRGKSHGPYQIQRAYWKDALEYAGKIGDPNWNYDKNVYNKAKCEQIINWYMKRHAKSAYNASNDKILASVHNGGPSFKNRVLKSYWNKIRKHL